MVTTTITGTSGPTGTTTTMMTRTKKGKGCRNNNNNKFVRDSQGQIVSMGDTGLPIMIKEITEYNQLSHRYRHKRCDKCGFNKYTVGDVTFIVQNVKIGRLQYLCPECAVAQGLPLQYYQQNQHSKGLPPEYQEQLMQLQQQNNNQSPTQQVSQPQQASYYVPTKPSEKYVSDCTTVSRGAMYNSSDIMACLCYF